MEFLRPLWQKHSSEKTIGLLPRSLCPVPQGKHQCKHELYTRVLYIAGPLIINRHAFSPAHIFLYKHRTSSIPFSPVVRLPAV